MIDQMQRRVTAQHLARRAFVYVRQSTLRQVMENRESTRRQYDLRRRARSLGWAPEQICVIDSDLGLSGADSDRKGFQRLVSEVSLGRAGIVLGLEVSRLARNNADWHRLLELCAQSDTLILDEDGIYSPAQYNDRLLLGLKGTMSEAELHVMKARLLGGVWAKAERGELRCRLPVGFVYDPLDRVALDPDVQVRDTLKTFFTVYERTGSARAVVVYFNTRSLSFPTRPYHGPRKDELFWDQLTHARAILVLHNPRYAGAFAWGRYRTRRVNGRDRRVRTPRDEWRVLITDHHPGYITWERFERNQETLSRAARSWRREGQGGPPREGSALLQGIAVCGKCGKRMTTHYDNRGRQLRPRYVCRREGVDKGLPVCQSVPGTAIDAAVAELVLELMNPQMLELALSAQDELRRRIHEADALRAKAVQRLEEEVDLAGRRHRMADPSNRLVVDVLEAEWNACLLRLQDASDEQARQREQDRAELSERQRKRIKALATDFPALWSNPATPAKQRKRMLGHLIADVTIVKSGEIGVGVRLRGGADRRFTLPLPLSAADRYRTDPGVVALLDQLLADHSYAEIAAILNQRGVRTGRGNAFNARKVYVLRRDHDLKTRYERRRDLGLLTGREVAALLGIAPTMVNGLRRSGRLQGANTGGNRWLYERPANLGELRSSIRRPVRSPADGCESNEVQYAR